MDTKKVSHNKAENEIINVQDSNIPANEIINVHSKEEAKPEEPDEMVTTSAAHSDD